MPTLIVGADTPAGTALAEAVAGRGEIRVFVSEEAAAEALRSAGFKVALGDVSDASHVGSAAIGAFCAVLLAEAALDDRTRSFASDPSTVAGAWVSAVAEAGVRRVILVAGAELESLLNLAGPGVETAFVDANGIDAATLADRVVALDEAHTL
jgi:putative NADH-flavin reductase